MTDKLQSTLQESSKKLLALATSRINHKGRRLPEGVFDLLESVGAGAAHLKDAATSLEERSLLLDECDSLRGLPVRRESPEEVEFNKHYVRYDHLRNSRMRALLAITWSIYDSATKAIAPAILSEAYAKDERFTLSFSDFISLRNKDGNQKDKQERVNASVGGRIHETVRSAYGWPIGFSYTLRNQFIHTPVGDIGMALFKGISVADQFYFNADAINEMAKRCSERYRITPENSRRDPVVWPWHKSDLLELIKLCNEECDEALSILVEWSVEAFCNKATLLLQA